MTGTIVLAIRQTSASLLAQNPSPAPSPSILEPAPDPIGQIVAIIAIALALAAAILGYRIIRGGRGL